MKYIITVCSFFIVFFANAQCSLTVQFVQTPVCAGEDLSFAGYSTGSCPDAAYWVYNWKYNSGQVLLIDTLYSIGDSSFAFMSLDIYEILMDDLTVEVNAFDVSDMEVGSNYYEHLVSAPLFPLSIFYFGPLTSCNQLAELEINGGVAPYEILSDGLPLFTFSPSPGIFSPSLTQVIIPSKLLMLWMHIGFCCTLSRNNNGELHPETAEPLENGVPFYYQGLCSPTSVQNELCQCQCL
ncbi:MAG: hypothetical protein IPP69_12740 [Flavobacteriales bacterium]|nr:hypothetical protein [Flavobacteriales bacterium]